MSAPRIAFLVIVSMLGAAAAAQADLKTLQNETLVDGSDGAIQLGFIQGDIGAAALQASAGDYPITLLAVHVLIYLPDAVRPRKSVPGEARPRRSVPRHRLAPASPRVAARNPSAFS